MILVVLIAYHYVIMTFLGYQIILAFAYGEST